MGLGNAISTAVSGLRASGLSVAVTANNIANVATEGFVPDQVVTTSVVTGRSPRTGAPAGGGVTTSVRPTVSLSEGTLELTSVDLATEYTRLIQAKAAYSQSLELINASGRMLRQSLDETA